MMYVIEQTRDEKIAMYTKCAKRELVVMLVNREMYQPTPAIEWRDLTYPRALKKHEVNYGMGSICPNPTM